MICCLFNYPEKLRIMRVIIIFITKNECIENLKSDLVNDANAEFHGSMETTWSPTLKHCSVYFFSRNGGMSIPLSVNSTNLYSTNHYSDVMMARWCLKSPASRSFTQRFNQVQIKENIKAPLHRPLCGEFTGDRRIPRINGQLRGKCFHWMTSSWKSKSLVFHWTTHWILNGTLPTYIMMH